MILLLRASHANEFELQNYRDIKNIEVITSQHPLTPISLPSTKLWSPTNLPVFPYRRQLLNRLIGGEQWLLGLEKYIANCIDDSNHRYKDITLHTAETYTPYTHQAVELRKTGKVAKLICTCWETIPHNNEKFGRLRHWKSEAIQYVDLFHTPTQRAKEALVVEGVSPDKIIVIPYGVDLTRFLPILPGVSRKVNHPRVLTVARLEKEKGIYDLESVARQLPQYNFVVVGKGSYRPQSPNITVSSVPYSQIHQLYQSANLFFLPSRTTATWEEQYGMALVEAMACGLPIIATQSGAIPEVVGNAGILVPEKNVDKMVKTICQILSHPDQIEEYSHLALARAASRYDTSKVALELAKLYV